MEQKINFLIIELEPNTFHPLVKAQFEELKDYWWVIDSGASKSVMDIRFSDLYQSEDVDPVMATGLGKEVVSTGSGIIPNLNLEGIDLGPQKVALVDLRHINEEYSKLADQKIIGLIGCDFLYAHEAVINFKNKTILLQS